MSLLAELRRRNVIRMAGLYLVGAWLIAQVAETLLPIFDTPGWVLKVLIVLLALGFLPALVFAWVFELTPEGIKRDREVSADASIAPRTGQRMDRVLIIVMAVALGYFAFDKFVLKDDAVPGPVAAGAGDQAAESASDAPTVAAQQDTSIAVLPFVNMSSDPEQEFFSDGLSEELLNQLAQIAQLRVIARTSSFSFKGKDVDVATIAQALDVANILEGSVRRSGDTLRITAQLIRTSDSSHLWSKTYDRKLTDVFAVQDEIANDVVSALKITLLPGQTVPKTQRTDSVEAFEHFMRGSGVIERGQVTNGGLAAAELRQAIAIDPGYANAWASLSIAESFLAEAAQSLDERRAFIDKAKASAEKAIELAPDLADGYNARSGIRFNYELDWEGALADDRRAVELSPNDANWLTGHSYLLALLGGFEQAQVESRRAVAINPLSAFAQETLGMVYLFDGKLDEARAAFARAIVLEPNTNWANYHSGYLDLQAGRLDAAAAAFRRADGGFPPAGLAMVEHSRGNAAASEEALDNLKQEFGAGFAFQVASVYAWRGEKDLAFEWLDTALAHRDAGMARLRVDVTLKSLHDDPRFAALEKKVGFPE